MSEPRKFLIIDDNADGRSLLLRTILRKFPQSIALECRDAASALAIAGGERLDAIITHRAGEVDGIEMIRLLREANATVPIVMVSGIDRSQAALAAGATRFLDYDAWLRLGSIVAELLNEPSSREPWPASS